MVKNLHALKKEVAIKTEVFDLWKLQVITINPWLDDNKKQIGISVEAVIIEDNVDWKDYKPHCNAFEKLKFKIRDEYDTEKFKYQEIVIPFSFEKISIWGDYNNQLSIICKLATESEYKQMMANKATQTTAHRQPLPKGTNQ
ncbi:hypothetical protein [Streptococcus constellatus]